MNFRDSWTAWWDRDALRIAGTTDLFPNDFSTSSLRRMPASVPGVAVYEIVFARDKEPFCGRDLVGPVHYWARDIGAEVHTLRITAPGDDEFAEIVVPAMSLHEACYQGRVDIVAHLLASGADPNAPAAPSSREWTSSAGGLPKPLNCVAIAAHMTTDHVEIARLLIEHGATVEESVLTDHTIEMTGEAPDMALRRLLEAPRSS